jgi:hypothetical protein
MKTKKEKQRKPNGGFSFYPPQRYVSSKIFPYFYYAAFGLASGG